MYVACCICIGVLWASIGAIAARWFIIKGTEILSEPPPPGLTTQIYFSFCMVGPLAFPLTMILLSVFRHGR